MEYHHPYFGVFWYDPSPSISGNVIGSRGVQSARGKWYVSQKLGGDILRYTPARSLGERIFEKLNDGGHRLELSLRDKRMTDFPGMSRNTKGWEVVFNVAGLEKARKGTGRQGCP